MKLKQKIQNRGILLMFIALLCVSSASLYFLNSWNSEEIAEGFDIELENILNATIRPENGENIFFIDTIGMKKRRRKLKYFTARQACAIESAGDFISISLNSNF